MSTTIPKIQKQFDSKYNQPHLKVSLQEQGWKYVGQKTKNLSLNLLNTKF